MKVWQRYIFSNIGNWKKSTYSVSFPKIDVLSVKVWLNNSSDMNDVQIHVKISKKIQ